MRFVGWLFLVVFFLAKNKNSVIIKVKTSMFEALNEIRSVGRGASSR